MVDPKLSAVENGDDLPEPPPLRRLRWLVTALTLVLIVGVIIIAGALVIRITQPQWVGQEPITANRLAVPAGERITATGTARGALTLVTVDADGVERLRLYDAETGAAQQTILIEREQP